MTDGEQMRALLATLWWSGLTSAQRGTRTPVDYLGLADVLLLSSYDMGAPLSDGERTVTLSVVNSAFHAQRFHDWLLRQDEATQAIYRGVIP
jgi:hypothetical protein